MTWEVINRITSDTLVSLDSFADANSLVARLIERGHFEYVIVPFNDHGEALGMVVTRRVA